MASKGTTISESNECFYKRLITQKSYNEKVISIPHKNIEEFHGNIYSLL